MHIERYKGHLYIHVIMNDIKRALHIGKMNPVSILYKSIAGRYRPVRVADGPITARYRLIKNASWETYDLIMAFAVCTKAHIM